MNLETIISSLKADFEIVEIPLPTGQIVPCVSQEQVLVPLAKVIIYGMGQSAFTAAEAAEMEQLKQTRRADQRAFKKSGKLERLYELQRKQDNRKKSLENLEALLAVGMSDTSEDIKKVIAHLLELGATVTASTAGGAMVRSQLAAPQGLLTVQTGWKVLDDGQRYMTTIHFVPPKPG